MRVRPHGQMVLFKNVHRSFLVWNFWLVADRRCFSQIASQITHQIAPFVYPAKNLDKYGYKRFTFNLTIIPQKPQVF